MDLNRDDTGWEAWGQIRQGCDNVCELSSIDLFLADFKSLLHLGCLLGSSGVFSSLVFFMPLSSSLNLFSFPQKSLPIFLFSFLAFDTTPNCPGVKYPRIKIRFKTLLFLYVSLVHIWICMSRLFFFPDCIAFLKCIISLAHLYLNIIFPRDMP